MIAKRIIILVSGLILSIVLHGCSSSVPAINYDGKVQPVSTVEKILGDKLEVENPDLDIDVTITQKDDSK